MPLSIAFEICLLFALLLTVNVSLAVSPAPGAAASLESLIFRLPSWIDPLAAASIASAAPIWTLTRIRLPFCFWVFFALIFRPSMPESPPPPPEAAVKSALRL